MKFYMKVLWKENCRAWTFIFPYFLIFISENAASKTMFNIGVLLFSSIWKAGLGSRSKPSSRKGDTLVD